MPEWIFQIIGMVVTGIGVYAGIKADLAALHVKADMAHEAANQAHTRIDALLNRQRH